MFYLVRHGKTDYKEKNTKIYQGFGTNLAPLSQEGIREIKAASKDVRLRNADIILSSPYTRALQTAAILSKELGVDIAVETDLHEWLANKNYIYEPDEKSDISYMEFVESGGVYPEGGENGGGKDWEDVNSLRDRFLNVLRKYSQYDNVIVACHGMMIQSLNGGRHPGNGEIVEFELDAGTAAGS